MKPNRFKLILQTNYNGVTLTPDWNRCPDADELTPEQEDVVDMVSCDLPEKTYDMRPEHGLTNSEEQELINDAKSIIAAEFPDVDIVLRYDHQST